MKATSQLYLQLQLMNFSLNKSWLDKPTKHVECNVDFPYSLSIKG